MKAKTEIDMGLKVKKKKATSTRILSIAKRSDILPVLPLMSALHLATHYVVIYLSGIVLSLLLFI